MASTFTPNIQLEEPARGDQVGVWDTPVNNNETLTDLVVGAINTISLNNSPVVLAAAQFQSKGITFNSTLTGSVTITFPTSFKKSYEIYNTCTGSSAFIITLTTTASSGTYVSCPPGEIVDVVNDGINLRFKNIGRVGTYWDYAGSSVPNWVSGCGINNVGPVPPYLNCDGTTFTSSFYPQLAIILGGNTLPDRRGTAGYTLNQGTGRLTTASGGLDGNTNFATKLTDSVTIGTSNLPPYTPAGNNSALNIPDVGNLGSPGGGPQNLVGGVPTPRTAVFTGTPQGGVSDPMSAIGTGTVYGITMIRSA